MDKNVLIILCVYLTQADHCDDAFIYALMHISQNLQIKDVAG